MKKVGMLAIVALFCFWPVVSEAFLCWGKDFSCLAKYILPNNQTVGDSENYREWAANEGHVIGRDGNIIEFKLKFDNQSFETLRYDFKWYSVARRLLEIKRFGLEIDICDPSNTLQFDDVKSDFPSEARATRDTDLSDPINSCKNAIGLLVKNPAALEWGKDYHVYFFLKDQIPAEGLVISPYLQIVADTGLLQSAAPDLGGVALFEGLLLGGYRSKYEYFAVESDTYIKGDGKQPWRIYPDGSGGLCWSEKGDSKPCTNYVSETPGSLILATRENAPRYFGVTTLPYGDFQPIEELKPDFHIKKLWLETKWGFETYTYGMSESIKIRTLTENIGQAKPDENVEMRWYLSDGYKKDKSSNWIHIATASTPKENLSPGETASETETFKLSDYINEPGIRNVVACADRTKNQDNGDGKIKEEHESNNCSTEGVFEVKDDSITPINKPNHDFIVSALQLTNTPLPMSVDGYYGARVAIRNIGTQKPHRETRLAYEINGPSTNYQWVAVDYDSIKAEDLKPNEDHWEGIYALVHAPTTAGTYSFRVRVDCDNSAEEIREDNNIASLQFEVKPLPSIIVTRPGSNDEWSSQHTKHIEWSPNNFPTPGYVSVEYSMDNGSSWRTIETRTHNDGGLNWNMCKSKTTDSRHSYIRIRSVEYPDIFGVSPRFYINHKRGCK